MKKLATISLFALLVYTQLGYYGQFLFLQWRLKEAAREAWIAALPDKAFFRVSLADVNARGRWEEAGRECWYGDHLYDVIRQVSVNGKTWLFCLDDEREEKLIRRSGEYAHGGNSQTDKKASHLLSIRLHDVLLDLITVRIERPSDAHSRWRIAAANALPTYYAEITVPPPRG